MSQTLEMTQSTWLESQSPSIPAFRDSEIEQFSYRPVPLLAIIGIVLGVLSVSVFLGILGLGLALLGIVTSLAATLRIASDRTAYSGLGLAMTGLVLSAGFFAGGVWQQIHLYKHEVPEGYQRISFAHDISRFGFIVENYRPQLHPRVESLVGQEVFLKGWMFPLEQKRGIVTFLLVKDNGLCCFGQQPDPSDVIIVHIKDEQGVNYTAGMVSLAGRFDVHPDFERQLAAGNPVYLLEAEHFSKSWTMF